jgi:hypothetical protein
LREITDDIFEYCKREKPDAFCIPSNGYVKTDGGGVMGRGLAKQALDRWPEIGKLLGDALKANGNCVQVLCTKGDIAIVAFPTKETYQTPSTIGRIRTSMSQLLTLADEQGWKNIVMPRPGCGNGQLSWTDRADNVKDAILPMVDDRITIVDNESAEEAQEAVTQTYTGKWGKFKGQGGS